MKLRSALLAATVMAAPAAAMAQPVNGIYIGAGVGGTYLQDQTIKNMGFPQAHQAVLNGTFPGDKIRTDWGLTGVLSVGWGFGNGLRAEVEGGVRQNSFQRVSGGIVNSNASGDQYKYSAMVNVLYDFDLASMGVNVPITPYIGAGVGYAWTQLSNFMARGNSGAYLPGAPGGFPSALRSTDSDGNFAYQGIVGAAYNIAAVPGLALTLEYRFLGTAGDRSYNGQFFGAAGPAAKPIATRANFKVEDDYNHSILLGVRYAFNAAPPPVVAPAPVARAEAARTYLVFFDWDRADLTDRARQIIAEAAQATTRVQTTRIMVSGHTDTTGSAAYNQALSVRRANNVAAELVRLGVPRAAITTQGFGFSRPLVPTGPGVREPQNRRVEIVLQ